MRSNNYFSRQPLTIRDIVGVKRNPLIEMPFMVSSRVESTKSNATELKSLVENLKQNILRDIEQVTQRYQRRKSPITNISTQDQTKNSPCSIDEDVSQVTINNLSSIVPQQKRINVSFESSFMKSSDCVNVEVDDIKEKSISLVVDNTVDSKSPDRYAIMMKNFHSIKQIVKPLDVYQISVKQSIQMNNCQHISDFAIHSNTNRDTEPNDKLVTFQDINCNTQTIDLNSCQVIKEQLHSIQQSLKEEPPLDVKKKSYSQYMSVNSKHKEKSKENIPNNNSITPDPVKHTQRTNSFTSFRKPNFSLVPRTKSVKGAGISISQYNQASFSIVNR